MMQNANSMETLWKKFRDADDAIEDKQATIYELQKKIEQLGREIDELDEMMMQIENDWFDANGCTCGLEDLECEGDHE